MKYIILVLLAAGSFYLMTKANTHVGIVMSACLGVALLFVALLEGLKQIANGFKRKTKRTRD